MNSRKDKYVKIELSHYELQIINTILQDRNYSRLDWFSPQNLADIREIIQAEVNKINEVD